MTSPCINNDFNDIQRTHHEYFPLLHYNLILTTCMLEGCLNNLVSCLTLLWWCITSTKQGGCSDAGLQDIERVALHNRWLFDTSRERFWKISLVRSELWESLPRSDVESSQLWAHKALLSKGHPKRLHLRRVTGHSWYGAVPKCLLRAGRKVFERQLRLVRDLRRDGRNRNWLGVVGLMGTEVMGRKSIQRCFCSLKHFDNWMIDLQLI